MRALRLVLALLLAACLAAPAGAQVFPGRPAGAGGGLRPSTVLWTPQQLVTAGSATEWWDGGSGTTISSGVSSWTDRASAVAVTQATGANRPAYSSTAFNGVAPGLTFNGTTSLLEITGIPTGLPTGASPGWLFALGQQTALVADTGGRAAVSYGSASARRRIGRTVTSAVNRATAGSDSVLALDTVVDMSDYFTAFTFVSATDVSGRVNGQNFGPAAVVSATGTTRLRIGASTSSTADGYWSGQLAQVLGGPGTLSLADQQRLEGWAAWTCGLATATCGLQSTLPVGHPYKSAPPYL